MKEVSRKNILKNKIEIHKILQVGIDEVGRGPIAGPVAVGAFAILNESGK